MLGCSHEAKNVCTQLYYALLGCDVNFHLEGKRCIYCVVLASFNASARVSSGKGVLIRRSFNSASSISLTVMISSIFFMNVLMIYSQKWMLWSSVAGSSLSRKIRLISSFHSLGFLSWCTNYLAVLMTWLTNWVLLSWLISVIINFSSLDEKWFILQKCKNIGL